MEMSVFKTDSNSLEERVKTLEKKVKQLEVYIGKSTETDIVSKPKEEDDEDFCTIT